MRSSKRSARVLGSPSAIANYAGSIGTLTATMDTMKTRDLLRHVDALAQNPSDDAVYVETLQRLFRLYYRKEGKDAALALLSFYRERSKLHATFKSRKGTRT